MFIRTSTGDPESGDVVGALITRHQEPARRIDSDYSWIIAERCARIDASDCGRGSVANGHGKACSSDELFICASTLDGYANVNVTPY